MGDPEHRLLRSEARHIYGQDASGYDAGRPDYPARVYEILRKRCGLASEIAVLEVGPGTGLVTRHLVNLGARVTAVEPDPELRSYLEASDLGPNVDLVPSILEDVELPEASFDLAVAATSFHWVDQPSGLRKLGQLVRPGGWVAIWWTVFGDPDRPDPFADAVQERLGEDLASQRSGAAFQLDIAGRTSDLVELGGFGDVAGEHIHWTTKLDTSRLRALYGSLINLRRRPKHQRDALLAVLTAIAEEEFGGAVERPFVTAIYTGRLQPSVPPR